MISISGCNKRLLMLVLNKKSLSRAASRLLTVYFQLCVHKYTQWKPWWQGCIYTAVEDGHIPSGHQGDHRWFPCKIPLSDQWIYTPEGFSQLTLLLLMSTICLKMVACKNCIACSFPVWIPLFKHFFLNLSSKVVLDFDSGRVWLYDQTNHQVGSRNVKNEWDS